MCISCRTTGQADDCREVGHSSPPPSALQTDVVRRKTGNRINREVTLSRCHLAYWHRWEAHLHSTGVCSITRHCQPGTRQMHWLHSMDCTASDWVLGDRKRLQWLWNTLWAVWVVARYGRRSDQAWHCVPCLFDLGEGTLNNEFGHTQECRSSSKRGLPFVQHFTSVL